MTGAAAIGPTTDDDVRYEERVVAFLDILGWADLVRRSASAATLRNLIWPVREMESRAEMWKQLKTDPRSARDCPDVSHFSDCIVISMRLTDRAMLACDMVAREVRRISIRLLQEVGTPVRGAIVCGDFFHAGSVAFGPALVEAARLEKEVAFYPRTIIADDYAKNVILPIWNPALPDEPYHQARVDHDGFTYLDILKPLDPSSDPDQPEFREFLTTVREKIRQGYQDAKEDLRKRPKWGWLVGYLNEVLAEHPSFGIEPLSV